MTRAEALAELKNYIRETTYDAAWGDTLLISYMAEGQDKFCEGTGFFQDYTKTITLSTGEKSYAIPARTIQILDIFNGTKRLGKFREEDRGMRDTTWNPSDPINRSGAPLAWQVDRTTGYVVLDGTPTTADNGTVLTVGVWRYSTYALDNNNIDPVGAPNTPAPIEIPLQFQRAVIEYAAYKALSSHDMEKQDKMKARDHYTLFREYVREGKRAMQRYHGLETRVGTDQSYVW